MMGDHVGYALCACQAKGVKMAVLAGQFAKLLKIACGHRQTHVAAAELDLQMLAAWCSGEPRTFGFEALARGANTARQVLQDSGNDPSLISLVCGRARESAGTMASGLEVKALLVGYDAEVLYYG